MFKLITIVNKILLKNINSDEFVFNLYFFVIKS